MKLALAFLLAAGFVLVLPFAIPIGGVLFLWDAWPPRRKPAVRPRRRVVRDGAFLLGDTVAVPVGRRRVMLVHRTRRSGRWSYWHVEAN